MKAKIKLNDTFTDGAGRKFTVVGFDGAGYPVSMLTELAQKKAAEEMEKASRVVPDVAMLAAEVEKLQSEATKAAEELAAKDAEIARLAAEVEKAAKENKDK